MSQSLVNIKIHLIFSTKNRAACLSDPSFCQALYGQIENIASTVQCPAIQVGGWVDHLHILLSLSRTETISDLTKELKRRSTLWIKEQRPGWQDFSWQGGYAAFSVSQTNLPVVIEYIKNQQVHHGGGLSFQDEYRNFLQTNEIFFQERYLWD